MFAGHRPSARTFLVIGLSAFGVTAHVASAQSQIQNQWKSVDKTLSDYVSEGFVIQTILLDRVTPVSVQATIYFLRKDNILARCSETVTRRGGSTTALSVACAELVKPATN
ncbi:MAG: hypothetical protein M9939_22265 [Mesorhizobium sp.]|nr:hypothetical protein [Mesorhizobium sp.]MCO5163862.1 hypothetical protein [Mesorhizobium sp.]